MPLPTRTDLLSLDWSSDGQPFCLIHAKGDSLDGLDWSVDGQPFWGPGTGAAADIEATLTVTCGDDTVSGSATVDITTSATAAGADATLSASASVSIGATASLTGQAATVEASATLSIGADASLALDASTVTGAAAVSITGSATATDNGQPVDLTGKTVRLGIKLPDGTILSRVPTVLSPATAGVAEYYPVAADIATTGIRSIQLHTWDAEGKLVSYPQTYVPKIKVWSGVPVAQPT